MEEVWKPVIGYDNIYRVSSLGVIKSEDHNVTRSDGCARKQKGRILQLSMCHKGYLRVRLSFFGKQSFLSVHRLVAQAFIPNPENKPQVNHINGRKDDNRVENLEWCTNSENQKHAVRLGLAKHNYGENHHNSKLNNAQSLEVKEKLKSGRTLASLGFEYAVSLQSIYNIKAGKTYNK